MQVQIGSTTADTPQTPAGASSTNISDGPLAWANYTGTYTVPAGQTTTRFEMTAVSTASGNETVGNFIDNAVVGTPACLTATMAATNKTAGAGTLTRTQDTLQYTATATNNGGVSSGSSVLTTTIPAGTTYVPGSLVVGGVPVSDAGGDDTGEVSNGTVTARIGSGATSSVGGAVAVGASVAVSFKVTVNQTVTAGTVLSDQANLGYTSPPSSSTLSAVSTSATNLVSATTIALTKSVDRTTDVNGNGRLDAGDTISYQFAVTDTGSVPLTGISVTDNKVGTVNCPSTSLAVGASVICTASYTATSADATAGSVVNTATASGTPPSGASAITSTPSSVTTPMYVNALTVSNSVSSSSVSAVGANTVFTTVVTNGGNTTLTGVNLVDTLASPAGPTPDSASCTVNQPTTLAPGASYSCTANYAAKQADLDNGKIVLTSAVTGTNPQSATVSGATSSTVLTAQTPGMSVTSSAAPTRVTAAGQTVVFSFAVTNTGNVTVNGIAINDSFSSPAGPVPTITCTTTTLAPNASTTCTSANYTVLQADITAGQVLNTATAQGTSAGGATVTSAASSVSVVANPPVISFAPTAGEVGVAFSQQPTVTGGDSPFSWAISAGSLPSGVTLNASTGLISGTPTASGNFSFTLKATDSKSVAATKTVSLVIAALPTFTFGSPATPQVGISYSTVLSVSGGTGPVVWSISTGTLPPGLTLDAASGTVSGTPTTSGSYPFTVKAVDANNQSTTKSTTLAPTAGPLVITKTANVASTTAGGTVTYTISIANSSSTAFSGVAFTDALTGVLDDAAYNNNASASTGTVSYANSTISWTGNVAANATVTVTYTVTVNSPDNGDQCIGQHGQLRRRSAPTAVVERSIPVAAVTVHGRRVCASSPRPTRRTTTPGGTVHYSVVVTNTGQDRLHRSRVSPTDLTDVLDDAAFNSDASCDGGQRLLLQPHDQLDRQPGRRRQRHDQLFDYRGQYSRRREPESLVTTAVTSSGSRAAPAPAAARPHRLHRDGDRAQTPGPDHHQRRGVSAAGVAGTLDVRRGVSGSTAADTGGSHPGHPGQRRGVDRRSRQGNRRH